MGEPNVYVDVKKVTLKIAPFIIHGVAMVPLRFIVEHFDLRASWIPVNHVIDLLRISMLQSIQNIGNEVILQVDPSVTPQLSIFENPNRLVIDLPNIRIGETLNKRIPIYSKLITNIYYDLISNSPPIVRLNIGLTPRVKVKLIQNVEKRQVNIQLAGDSHPLYKVVIRTDHSEACAESYRLSKPSC